MLWFTRGEGRDQYLETECCRYTVTRTPMGRGYEYSAWKRLQRDPKLPRGKKDPMPEGLGSFPNSALAKQQCEADAEKVLTQSTDKNPETQNAI